MQLTLRKVVDAELHIIPQVVKAEFVIRPVGNVGLIRFFALDWPQVEKTVVFDHIVGIKHETGVVHNRTNRQTQCMKNRPHPLHISPGQIVIDRHQMRPSAE